MYQILNLANTETTDIQYKISKFPDGQQTVDLNPKTVNPDYPVLIISRLNDFKDLELILCATAAVKECDLFDISLYTPYFLGARSDRKFQDGGINYLKTVICPIINSQEYRKVFVLDPHSDVLEACLDRFVNLDNKKFARNVILNQPKADNIVLVSPDAGALKKVFKIQKEFGIEDMIIGAKNRDVKGQITHTSISGNVTDPKGKTFIIFDDICDGGRTFIELAKVIKETYGDVKIVLAITHGIFTKGLEPIREYIDYIYTTNSVKENVYTDKTFNVLTETETL